MFKKSKKINWLSLFTLITLSLIIILFLIAKFEKPSFEENSIDNPQKNHDYIQPVLLQGNSGIAVILIHGLGATPWETNRLAEYLNSRNITTLQVLLAGHGKSIYDLEQTSSEQWYQSVEEAYNSIKESNKFIIGNSLGSLLAIELSEKESPNGIILISTPIFFKDKRIEYSPLLKYFKRYSHRDIEPELKPFYYENFPVKSLAEMISYITKIKKISPVANSPVLIIQSKDDPRLDPKSAQYIYDNVGSEKKEIMWLNSNKHVLIIEYADEDEEFKDERDQLFKKMYNFIIENS